MKRWTSCVGDVVRAAQGWWIASTILLASGIGLTTGFVHADEPAAVSFRAQVAPILVGKCLACHGERDARGEYQLHTFETLLAAGESGLDPITAGEPGSSYLLDLLVDSSPESRMPKGGQPLSADEIATVERWIREGARFDSDAKTTPLVELVPRTRHPNPPETYAAAVPVTAVAFSPNGEELAVGGYHEILVHGVDDGALRRRLADQAERIYDLATQPGGHLLAVAAGTPGQMGEVKLIDPQTGETVRHLARSADSALSVAFSPDGKQLAAGGTDRAVRVFDVETGVERLRIEDHADWVTDVAWNPDGTRLVSGSRDKTAKLFDAATGEGLVTYGDHREAVHGVGFTADGQFGLSTGVESQIHAWKLGDGKREQQIGGFGGEVFRLVVRGDRILTACADRIVRMHDATKRNELRKFGGHDDWVYAVDLHAQRQRLATGTHDGVIRIFNTEDGKELLKFAARP
jgi:WD40 repeat protein/mono/diheme cytochrome c family protein